MRIIAVLAFLFSLSACSLYQSDGREAIQDNKSEIVVSTGFDIKSNTVYQCLRSIAEPEETKGPVEVIDHEAEADGYSAYLVSSEEHKHLMIYKVPHKELLEPHRYCDLDTLGDYTPSKINIAIRLGVRLLAEQKELD